MNSVENLLEVPFLKRTYEEKLKIKQMGPYQPEKFALFQHMEEEECFLEEVFPRTPWLTVSHEKNSLFCFYCLLFGGDYLWTKSGLNDFEHLADKIKEHGLNPTHINNVVNYKTFGNLGIFRQIAVDNLRSAAKHNQLVTRNRHVLNEMIDILKFCGHLDSPSQNRDGSRNPSKCEIFLDILSEISKSDNILEDYLSKGATTKETLRRIQSELLECIYEVYAQNIAEDIKNANYVALHVDEVSDVSWNSQFAITLRYCLVNGALLESFLCFVDACDKTVEKLMSVLVQTLNSLNLKNKLIAQAYDGALSVERPLGNPHVLMADCFPHAHCVHSYAHRMYSIVKKACSQIKTVRLFFGNVNAFSVFFSTSYKLDKLLGAVLYGKISVLLGNTDDMEPEIINFLVEHKPELIQCFIRIQNESYWDDKTVDKSSHLQNLLQDDQFLFLLKFFQPLLGLLNILYNTIQSKESSRNVVQQAQQSFGDSVEKVKVCCNPQNHDSSSSDTYDKRKNDSVQMVIAQVCDIIIHEMNNRFKNYDLFYSFSVVDPKEFEFYAQHFPMEHLETISNNYKMIEKDKLRAELTAMYNSNVFRHASTFDLPLLLKVYDLQEEFFEVLKLLEIVLVTPVPTPESERRFSTLLHIREFLRNSSSRDNLNPVAALAIHREYIAGISRFNEKVIEKFSLQEHRREMYYYK